MHKAVGEFKTTLLQLIESLILFYFIRRRKCELLILTLLLRLKSQ